MTTWERFQSATLSLARSGPIKDRLNDAYRKHLADLAAEELPEQIRDDFRALTCSLHREPPLMRGDDAIRATIRKMSNADANSAATTVVRMFAALPRSAAASRAPTAATIVPLFPTEQAKSVAG
jgi:hypothetical protein